MAKTKTTTKKTQTKTSSKAGEEEVKVCRRRGDRRTEEGDASNGVEEKAGLETGAEPGKELPERRKKVQRRRQIDPTTCERDYTNDEIEFMHALDAYKRANGRMFPTCSEILEVVRSIGYEKIERMEIVEEEIDELDPTAGAMQGQESEVGTTSSVAAPLDANERDFSSLGGASNVSEI